jgi:hypothetical protein
MRQVEKRMKGFRSSVSETAENSGTAGLDRFTMWLRNDISLAIGNRILVMAVLLGMLAAQSGR